LPAIDGGAYQFLRHRLARRRSGRAICVGDRQPAEGRRGLGVRT
jgi:hypothetical protein